MTSSGYGAQLVEVTEDHSYSLNLPELDKLLLNDEIKDLPVVVVSIAGAYRGGKSFILNFFIRYLRATPSAREDGSWIGKDDDPLTGFNWKSGAARTTTGILMWSKPFLGTFPNGDKVAILLMDTQGTFDDKSTIRDCSTIFGLSTLLSSVQIYNLFMNIKEDDLQHLELFIEYGRLAQEKGSKAFQVLQFLVRDWQFPEDYAYGALGGDKLLAERLEITPTVPQEMQVLRQHLRTSFEKLSCFLMPHPGFIVLKKKSTGKISDIADDFRTYLNELVKHLFDSENLMAKTINGQRIKAKEMHTFFKAYVELFNSKDIPNPENILTMTIKAGLLLTLNDARELYEKGMDAACGPSQLSVPAVDVQVLHKKHMSEACEYFTNKKNMGSKEEADTYFDKLKKTVEERLSQFIQSNEAKTQDAITKAQAAYEEVIEIISNGKPLCLHPNDLKKLHNAGIIYATKRFDKTRKRFSDQPDDERTQFVNNFDKRYTSLLRTNEDNSKAAMMAQCSEYFQHMQSKIGLSDFMFEMEHNVAQFNAISNFCDQRNMPALYLKDIYTDELVEKTKTMYKELLTLKGQS